MNSDRTSAEISKPSAIASARVAWSRADGPERVAHGTTHAIA
jgi:hypothetical protein